MEQDIKDMKELLIGLTQQVSSLSNKVNSIEKRLYSIENRVISLETKVDSIENRLDSLEINLTNRIEELEQVCLHIQYVIENNYVKKTDLKSYGSKVLSISERKNT